MFKYKTQAGIVVKQLIISTLFVILTLTGTTATFGQSGGNTANSTPTIADELKECSQMLDKSLSEVSACKDLAAARMIEVNSYKTLTESQRQEIVRLEAIVKASDERMKELEKQKCSQVSLFWGIFKIRQC